MRFRPFTLFAMIALTPASAFAANPFNTLKAPAVPEEPVVSSKKIDPELPPLRRWAVSNYILMGILVSEKGDQNKQVAILRTPAPHSRTYLLRFGDLLGNQDGYIKKFESSGLIIVQRNFDDNAPEEVRLAVRNRGANQSND